MIVGARRWVRAVSAAALAWGGGQDGLMATDPMWPVGEQLVLVTSGAPSLLLWEARATATERAAEAGFDVQETWPVVFLNAPRGWPGIAAVVDPFLPVAVAAQVPGDVDLPLPDWLRPKWTGYVIGAAERWPAGAAEPAGITSEVAGAAMWAAMLEDLPAPPTGGRLALGVVLDSATDPFGINLLAAWADLAGADPAAPEIREIVLPQPGASGAWRGLDEAETRDPRQPVAGWWLVGDRALAAAVERTWTTRRPGGNRPRLIAWSGSALAVEALAASQVDAVVQPHGPTLGRRLVATRLAVWLERAEQRPEVPDYLRRRATDRLAAWREQDAAEHPLRTYRPTDGPELRARVAAVLRQE